MGVAQNLTDGVTQVLVLPPYTKAPFRVPFFEPPPNLNGVQGNRLTSVAGDSQDHGKHGGPRLWHGLGGNPLHTGRQACPQRWSDWAFVHTFEEARRRP